MSIWAIISLTVFLFILATTNRYGPQIAWFIAVYVAVMVGAFIIL